RRILLTGGEDRARSQQLRTGARYLERDGFSLQLELQLGDAEVCLRDIEVGPGTEAVEDRKAEGSGDGSVREPTTVLTGLYSGRVGTNGARGSRDLAESIGNAKSERRKRLIAGVEPDAQRGKKIGARHGETLASRSRREFRRPKRRAIGERGRISERCKRRNHCRDGIGVQGRRQHNRPIDWNVEQSLQIQNRQFAIVLRL